MRISRIFLTIMMMSALPCATLAMGYFVEPQEKAPKETPQPVEAPKVEKAEKKAVSKPIHKSLLPLEGNFKFDRQAAD